MKTTETTTRTHVKTVIAGTKEESEGWFKKYLDKYPPHSFDTRITSYKADSNTGDLTIEVTRLKEDR